MAGIERKIDILRGHMAAGRWREAVLLAAKFQNLGDERAAILAAREAYLRPAFQRQLKRCPEALQAEGRAALERRYGRA